VTRVSLAVVALLALAAPGFAQQYPPTRAAELKARLLDRPSAPEAASWASLYAIQPELDRLEPMARAAERIWAARTGLAAGAKGDEKKRLQQILASYESCPIDSIALRRASTGLARIGVVIPLTGRFDRYGKTFSQGLRLAIEDHNKVYAPNLALSLYDSEGDPLVGARKARWLLRDHGVSILIPKGSAGILVSTSPEDSARAEAVLAACKSAGIDVAGKETVEESAVDLTHALGALKEKKASGLFLLTPPRLAGIAAAQLSGTWPKARIYGFDALDPSGQNAEARGALEGATYVVADYAMNGAARDSFETRYQKAYGEAPTRMSVRGYLVGLSVTRGIERGSLNASMLREALRTQLYDSDEGRALRALKPLVPAEPERYVVRSGKAVAAAPFPLSP